MIQETGRYFFGIGIAFVSIGATSLVQGLTTLECRSNSVLGKWLKIAGIGILLIALFFVVIGISLISHSG